MCANKVENYGTTPNRQQITPGSITLTKISKRILYYTVLFVFVVKKQRIDHHHNYDYFPEPFLKPYPRHQ